MQRAYDHLRRHRVQHTSLGPQRLPDWNPDAAGIEVFYFRDTDASLHLYRDALGLRITGTAENRGIEQERLNNVFGTRLRITALKAGAGLGIDLLEYLSPADGRPLPADTRANDLWHGQIHLAVDDVAAASVMLRKNGGRWLSPDAVDMGDTGLGFRFGLLERDPDGHGLLLIRRK